MRRSCLQFNVLLLPESYRRLLLKQGRSRYSPPLHGQGASLKTILPGMWYEIKQKQQKMPKARANINVYSSTRISGSSMILSCLTVSLSCGIVYSRVKRTPENEKNKTYPGTTYISSNGKSKENVGIRTRYVYIPFCSTNSTRKTCAL